MGRSASHSALGPEVITASVPLVAPATPPLTGASIAMMLLLASSAAIACAVRGPVVERSTKSRAFDPRAMPRSPSATSRTVSGRGRLAITMSARDATSAGDVAFSAPLLAMTLSAWPCVS